MLYERLPTHANFCRSSVPCFYVEPRPPVRRHGGTAGQVGFRRGPHSHKVWQVQIMWLCSLASCSAGGEDNFLDLTLAMRIIMDRRFAE